MTRPPAISIEHIEAAAKRIAPIAWRTPIVPSPWLSDLTGADVWLKLEIVQATGSFKIRGAANALALLEESRPHAKVVVTASAGNHGQAVAAAAARLGYQARIHLPASAPAVKRDAIARLGAIIVEAASYEAAEHRAHEDARDTGAIFVSPYDDADVIAGAGTVALEMIADRPDLDTFVVPLGGGGLLSGVAIVARARVKAPLVVGAEAEASPVFTAALAAGRPVTVDVKPTLADGLAGNMEPESQTFALVRDLVDRVETVGERAIETAMRNLISRDRLIAEGAAATAVGALLQGGLDVRGRHVGVVLSGRNTDFLTGQWPMATGH